MHEKILIIDDDRSFSDSLKDILTEKGYEVETLSDPSDTENCINTFNPDLLILDIFMPGRSGFNLLEDFRDRGIFQDIPKIVLTCLDDDVERMVAKSEGAEEYATKPVDVDGLLNKILKLLC